MLCARLAAAPPPDAAADAEAQCTDGGALATLAWGTAMFLCNAALRAAQAEAVAPAAVGADEAAAPPTVAAVEAWQATREHAAFTQDCAAALCSPAGAAAVAAFLELVRVDAQVRCPQLKDTACVMPLAVRCLQAGTTVALHTATDV